MRLLYIETSTPICSVGISEEGKIIALRESQELNSHASNTVVFIDEVVKESGLSLKDMDAVVISKGPGSYTGLRIGVSTAKGLCYALDKPLIAISSLQSMAFAATLNYDDKHLFCPMIDARRMEVYAGIYNHNNETIRPVQADIVDENTYAEFTKNYKLVCMGDGAEKCKTILEHRPNYIFDDNIKASVKNMVSLAEKAFVEKQFENVAYFEPFYLKDFVAGAPSVKGLR